MTATTHNPRAVMVTGGAGFIGCNFVRFLLESDADVRVITLDALTYAGHPSNLRQVEKYEGDRHHFVHGDIRDSETVRIVLRNHGVDTVACRWTRGATTTTLRPAIVRGDRSTSET